MKSHNLRTIRELTRMQTKTAEQTDIAFDICSRKHGGNRESQEAHEKVRATKQELHARILAFARQRGVYGMTADELAVAWNVTHNHVAPRISELRRFNLLVTTAQRRMTRSGCSARVLIAADVASEAK